MELDTLPSGKAPRSPQIAICRFCQFSAHSSPQIWRNDHNHPGGQAICESLPARMVVVCTRRLIYQRLKDSWYIHTTPWYCLEGQCPSPSRSARLDFLDQPTVAVWVAH